MTLETKRSFDLGFPFGFSSLLPAASLLVRRVGVNFYPDSSDRHEDVVVLAIYSDRVSRSESSHDCRSLPANDCRRICSIDARAWLLREPVLVSVHCFCRTQSVSISIHELVSYDDDTSEVGRSRRMTEENDRNTITFRAYTSVHIIKSFQARLLR
jgi:hypothetical protein